MRGYLPWTPLDAAVRANEALSNLDKRTEAHVKRWFDFGINAIAAALVSALLGGTELIESAAPRYQSTVAWLLLLSIAALVCGVGLLARLHLGRPSGRRVFVTGQEYQRRVERFIDRAGKELNYSLFFLVLAGILLFAALATSWLTGSVEPNP